MGEIYFRPVGRVKDEYNKVPKTDSLNEDAKRI